jgi:hypothetical protein
MSRWMGSDALAAPAAGEASPDSRCPYLSALSNGAATLAPWTGASDPAALRGSFACAGWLVEREVDAYMIRILAPSRRIDILAWTLPGTKAPPAPCVG